MTSATTRKPLGRPRLVDVAPHPVDIHAGQMLRARREELGLSQADIGAPSRISFQQVQKYENGKNRISASRLQEFADILGVPAAYFFPMNGASARQHRDDVSRLTRECADLSPKTVKHLIALARSIRESGVAV